jgi:hypothetical protein
MNDGETSTNQRSEAFQGIVGEWQPAAEVSPRDYLIDPSRYPSEGLWAFCRFDHPDVPALRLGFQRGGFNGGMHARAPSTSYLQLHLELMTREGALLWLPSGVYSAQEVRCAAGSMGIDLHRNGRAIFTVRGWPDIECSFSSEEGDLHANLRFDVTGVVLLPDCELPHCLFAMWESMGGAHGSIRYLDRSYEVSGMIFLDHTRVIARPHSHPFRKTYVYFTLYFDDGCGLFGYHSVDVNGRLIDNYCFAVYLDRRGTAQYVRRSVLSDIAFDSDGIAKSWVITWQTENYSLIGTVRVQDMPIKRSWGSAAAPQTRRSYSIIPLVLQGVFEAKTPGDRKLLVARGLAEYFDADLWPADMAASSVHSP